MADSLPLLHAEVVACQACSRLVQWREQVARDKVKRFADQAYWGKPLPGWGDPAARLVVLGLAPAAHGGNRTGRMFTGDESGNWLYEALHRYGFANQPAATGRDDGLALTGAYILNACRCAPPGNKPTPTEMAACAPFLRRELDLLPEKRVVLCLGKLAFDTWNRLLQTEGVTTKGRRFAHLAEFTAPGAPTTLCSYHPSQQNTFTGVLTRPMWYQVFARARLLCDNPAQDQLSTAKAGS